MEEEQDNTLGEQDDTLKIQLQQTRDEARTTLETVLHQQPPSAPLSWRFWDGCCSGAMGDFRDHGALMAETERATLILMHGSTRVWERSFDTPWDATAWYEVAFELLPLQC